MGCCENINNLIVNKNKDLSNSYYSFPKVIKEENLIEINKSGIIPEENKINHSPIKNNSTSKMKPDYKQNQVLDEINEVESEYKESSVSVSILTKDKITPKNKFKIFENLNIKNRNRGNLNKIKNLRKKRSQEKNKRILSDDKFNKKLNEYKNHINMKKIFYLNNLTKKKEEENNDFIFEKSMGDLSFKRDIFETICEKQNKRAIRNVRFKLFNESLEKKYN